MAISINDYNKRYKAIIDNNRKQMTNLSKDEAEKIYKTQEKNYFKKQNELYDKLQEKGVQSPGQILNSRQTLLKYSSNIQNKQQTPQSLFHNTLQESKQKAIEVESDNEIINLRKQRENLYDKTGNAYNILLNKKLEEDDIGWFDKTLGSAIAGVSSLLPAKYKIKNEDGNYYRVKNYSERKQEKILDSYESKLGRLYGTATYELGKIGATAVISTISNMIVPGSGLVGSAGYYSDIFSDSYNRSLEEGYTGDQAMTYATISSASEMILGKLLGGTTKALGLGDSGLSSTISKKLTDTLLKNHPHLANMLSSAVSEGSEEFVQEFLDKFNRNVILEEKDFKDSVTGTFNMNVLSDALYSGLVGSITGAVTGSFNGDNYSTKIPNQTENNGGNNIANINESNTYNYVESGNNKINEFRQSVVKYNLENSDKTNNLMNTIEKLISDKDYKIVFDDSIANNQGNPVNAQISNNNGIEIKLNPNSERAGEFLLVHEITHAIETDTMKKLVLDYASKHEDFNASLNSLKQTYGVDDVSSEVLADISGQLFGNQEFINNLSVEQPSVFRRIYNAIVSLANKITGNTNEALFIGDLKNKWETAYRTQNNKLKTTNYSFMSDKGLKNALKTNPNNQNLAQRLSIAKQMQQNGYTNEDIRQKTMWFQDLNDRWLFEITDKAAHIKNNLEKSKTYKLEEIFSHDKLFEAYPELKNIKIVTKNIKKDKSGNSVGGYYSTLRNTIALNNEYINKTNIIRNILLHEVQHKIQNIEKLEIGKTGNAIRYYTSLGEIMSSEVEMRSNMGYSEIRQNAPEISKTNPIHPHIKIINNNPNSKSSANMLNDKKVADLYNEIYNNGNKGEYNRAEINKKGSTKNIQSQKILHNGRRVRNNSLRNKKSIQIQEELDSSSFSLKQKQLDIILKNNPVYDDYHTWIRTIDDIKTFEETLQDSDWEGWEDDSFDPDYTGDMVKDALSTGKITVYSSYPIEQGIFVSPSKMEAESYSGNGKVYSKVVNLSDVAWIDPTQGQYAKVDNVRYSQQTNKWQEYLDKHYKSTGTRTVVKDLMIPSNSVLNKNNTNNSKNAMFSEETTEEPKIAHLLDKRPLKYQKGLKEEANKIYQKIVDKGKYVADLAKKTNNKELYSKYDQMGTARGTAEYSIGVEQVNNKGEKIGKSLVDIWEPITESGKEFDFSMYLLHKHNIDRFNQGKPIFGEDITSDMSKEEVVKYEKKNPEFIEWSKDINIYNKNLLQNMVDAGLTSEESQQYYNDTYNNYIRIYRDMTGNSPITMQNGKLKVNNPIKKAKGGTQDILPLKDSMAQQTLEVTSAIRRNEFGLELLKTLGSGEDVTEYGSEIISKNEDGTYSFVVFDNGKPIKIEIDEGLYESIKPTKRSEVENILPLKMSRKLLQFQRGLITDKNPFFLVRNFFKDLGDAPLNSKYTSKFLPNFARAYNEIINNGEYARLYKAMGGYQQSYFDNDSGLKLPSKKVSSKFVQAIQNVNRAVEMAPRLAEFISTIEDGGTIQTAMYNAAEITTNFKRGGEVTKALNRNFSNFLNASVQGFDKQFRNFTGQNGAKGYINLLSKAVVFGVVPSVLNHLLLQDDEDYEELPNYIKDNYYLFKTSDNNFIRIPKGRVVSIFGNAAYRTIEFIKGDKDAYKEFLSNAATNVAPNNPIGSNVLSPFIQVATNKSWNGSDIVPQRLQDLPNEEQFDEKTDEISKVIGKIFNISPKKVNYMLDQYSGVFGDTLLPMFTPQAENNPLASSFSVNSEITNKYSSNFYDIKDECAKKANSVNATDDDILKNKYLNSIQSEISELYKEKREIQMSSMKDSEKRKEVEKIQAQINDIAKNSIKNYKEINNTGNFASVDDMYFYKNNDNEWEKVKSTDKGLNLAIDSQINMEEYIKYKNTEFKSDRDSNGKTITNSRKNKIIKYVNDLKLSPAQKAIIIKMEYSSFDNYNKEIINYINNLKIDNFEKNRILEDLGFEINNGKISW